jgi:hypothetical protein
MRERNERFHLAARRIQDETGVRVEWAEAMREYVVDGRMGGSTARKARTMAKSIARRSEKALAEAQKGADQ